MEAEIHSAQNAAEAQVKSTPIFLMFWLMGCASNLRLLCRSELKTVVGGHSHAVTSYSVIRPEYLGDTHGSHRYVRIKPPGKELSCLTFQSELHIVYYAETHHRALWNLHGGGRFERTRHGLLAFNLNTNLGVLALLLSPLLFILVLMGSRVSLELIAIFFRIEENTARLTAPAQIQPGAVHFPSPSSTASGILH